MAIRSLAITCLLLASNASAKRPDIGFIYSAVSKLAWGPPSIRAYTTGILRMGGVVITISNGDSEYHKVTYDFSTRNHLEITDKQIESIIRKTLNSEIHIEPTDDCLGYLLFEKNNRVQRYDYLQVDNHLEVIRVGSLDRPSYQRAYLLATLQELQKRLPIKSYQQIFDQELGERKGFRSTLDKLKQRFFNPDYREQQVLQSLETTISDLTSISEQIIKQKNAVITDYQSSIALITEALQSVSLSLPEAISATGIDRHSAKQLTEIFTAHLNGTIVISEDNSQRLLSTLMFGISKALRYRIPNSLRLQQEDQVRELLERAEQIMPAEWVAIRLNSNVPLRGRYFYGQHQQLHSEKMQEAKQQIDDILTLLVSYQLPNTISDPNMIFHLNAIRSRDAKATRQVLAKKF